MRNLDAGVTMAHWTSDAVLDAVVPLTGRIAGFARRNGVRRSTGIELAVSEALTDAVRNQGEILAMGQMHVDAAIDHSCLSVRVAGDAPIRAGADASAVSLGMAVADRVESGAGDGAGTCVLMEFLLPGRPRRAKSSCEGRQHR